MSKNYFFLGLIMSACLVFSACKKDDPDDPELEIITSVNYTLTPTGGGDAVTFSFKDIDGDGGNAATITGGKLSVNETYTGSLELLNESVTPVDDITLEIEEKDLEHQFFFQSNVANLTVAYNDQDSAGDPIGLLSTVTTGAVASGSITITLRHEPDKSKDGVSDGDITNAGGETDIEVTFPVDVE